jgi:hypothetical protein
LDEDDFLGVHGDDVGAAVAGPSRLLNRKLWLVNPK